jgi:sulfate transport system ATP-binding protein
MSIQVQNISKAYGPFRALRNVSLEVPKGELVALLGPSGCGKTSLLRIIAGLEQADAGTVHLNDEDATLQSAGERGVGFVFQHYALFRHMTVFENVAFGLKVQARAIRPSKSEITERVIELLKLVQLDWQADRYPSQLSGGQRQRIALARALAVKPRVLLLDEPFGALDAQVRKDLRRWLRRLHDELHVTSVFVTHDQEEALEVADRVAVMKEGKIEQVGSPEEVYEHAATPFVYHFLGNVNLFHGRIHSGRARIASIEFAAPEHASDWSGPAVGYVRPHDLEIKRTLNTGETGIPAKVLQIYSVGAVTRVELQRSDTDEYVQAELSKGNFGELNLQIGETVFVKPIRMKVFPHNAPGSSMPAKQFAAV